MMWREVRPSPVEDATIFLRNANEEDKARARSRLHHGCIPTFYIMVRFRDWKKGITIFSDHDSDEKVVAEALPCIEILVEEARREDGLRAA